MTTSPQFLHTVHAGSGNYRQRPDHSDRTPCILHEGFNFMALCIMGKPIVIMLTFLTVLFTPPRIFQHVGGLHSTKIDFSTIYPPKHNTYCFFGGVDSTKTDFATSLFLHLKLQFSRGWE